MRADAELLFFSMPIFKPLNTFIFFYIDNPLKLMTKRTSHSCGIHRPCFAIHLDINLKVVGSLEQAVAFDKIFITSTSPDLVF